MARPKEFDRDTALQSAIGVFCEHGYEGTSTDALLGAMGISRQSLYDTFGDKRQLYLGALQRYVADSISSQIQVLNEPASPLKGLDAMLQLMAEKATAEETPGCMGIGAVCEFGRSDPEITKAIEVAGRSLQGALERRIAEGKAAGEISNEMNAREVAEFVKAILAGMKVAARGGAKSQSLRNIARIALRGLK